MLLLDQIFWEYFSFFNGAHREKLRNQQFNRRVGKNRILTDSDYCLHNQLKTQLKNLSNF